MRRQLFLWLATLAVLLGVYAAVRNGPAGPGAEQAGPLLRDLDPAAVDSLSISSPAGTVELTRSEGPWTVELDDGRTVRADPLMVERAVAALGSLSRDAPVSLNPERRGLFGLGAGSATVVEAGGNVLSLGRGGANGNSAYVRLEGDDAVYPAPPSVLEAFPTEREAWRDRAVVRFRRREVRELIYRGHGEEGRVVAIRSTPDGWFLTRPERREAHQRPPDIILLSIAQARAVEFLEPGDADGLPTSYELVLVLSDGSERHIEVLDAGEDNILRVAGRGVFRVDRERFDLIESTILSLLEEPPDRG
ncbi:MAG: DUF4340 domain-containing protein [Candidatus Eisenbacteria bacterium]|nr:DUF4340 domain-containing protein [Candidatus Eisenbacteria bacterium]